MAKARFPGKPPKTSQITRLRVSSNCSAGANDPSRLAAQQVAFGLKLYRQHFIPDDEDDDDFVGFERIGDTFVPQFQSKTLRPPDCIQQADDHPRWPPAQSATEPAGLFDSRQLAQPTTSVREWHERTVPVNSSRVVPPLELNGTRSERDMADKLPHKAKSTKDVLPPKSSSKSLPSKRLLEGGDQARKKKSREERDLCRKSQQSLPQGAQVPAASEILKQEKVHSVTTEGSTRDHKSHRSEEKRKKKKHKRHRSQNDEDDKEGKLREKIQQLLRSQWESRLQLVDVKSDPVPPQPERPNEFLACKDRENVPRDLFSNRTDSRQSVRSSISSSSASSEDPHHYKRQRLSSNSSSSSSARKSKIILRKARLQLNHRLLKQLRQPSRLQKLVEPEVVQPVEPPTKVVQPTLPSSSSSSILRPAQLVLQSAPTTQPASQRPLAPRPSTVKEPPAKPAILPIPPQLKISQTQGAGETTVNNPLGCAFVMEPCDSKRLPGTVVCGVCGAVRRYSFILQARKFGTFSCEPCRKFISRILLARVPVKCVSGTGHCIHPPVLRWNSSCPPEDKPTGGEVMTARCKACWLKLALTGFKMRESDHDDLRRLLPASMQTAVPSAADRPESLHWAPNRGQIIRMKSTSPLPNVPFLPIPPAAPTQETKTKAKPTQKTEHCPGSRTREKGGGGSGSSSAAQAEATGPRVKHVCRSALPGRAQSRATLEDGDSDRPSSKHSDGICGCCSLPDVTAPLPTPSVTTSSTSSSKASRSSGTDRKNSLSSPAMPLTTSLGERFPAIRHEDPSNPLSRVGLMTPAVRAWQQQESGRSRPTHVRTTLKSAPKKGALRPDLWERYDADRVWDQGFAICGSQKLGVTSSLCYLCGSAGRDELVSCSSCCEAFHPFCVADSAPLPSLAGSACDHWDRAAAPTGQDCQGAVAVIGSEGKAWICLNCVTCQICQSNSGERTVCSTCSKAYHWSCIGPAYPSTHRKRRSKWSCFSCAPLKDKFCPVCSTCHSTEQSEKLECDCCGAWIHAACEELHQEDFRLLCTLSHIEYVCRLCSPGKKSWSETLARQAVGFYGPVLAKLASHPSTELKAIGEKVARNEYRSCGEFCTDIRRLPVPNELIRSVLLAAMPWLHKEERLPTPQQAVSVGIKVEYDAESDIRMCSLCHGRGEGPANSEGRLVYCGNDLWVHVNCALWSNEVYEEVDGALQKVFDALARASASRCSHCGAKGATVSCATRGCPLVYHFPCALQESGVILLEGKRLVCRQHLKDPPNKSLAVHSSNFEVARCVYVDLGAESKRIKSLTPNDLRVAIGSLVITAFGQLRSDVSGGPTLRPVGYESRRKFWSTKEPWKLVTYTLRTIYVPKVADGKDTETNVTVSHEEDDVIMAESGLNLAELDTQDDRDLIHMVLEDANFEQELEGGPNAAVATSSPNPLRDSGFYSDGHSTGETSPTPAEDHALEAWLADPEHANFFLDSALLASLDIDNNEDVTSPRASSSASEEVGAPSGRYPQASESKEKTPHKKSSPKKHQLSYTQWKRMRLETRRLRSASRVKTTEAPSGSRRSTLDWNGNEAEWNSSGGGAGGGGLVANIKVSSLSPGGPEAPNWRRSKRQTTKPDSILQLDGAADSSETDSERVASVKQEWPAGSGEEPVKCRRCRRSYRTLQSFNKHAETCVELLSSGSSSEEESEEDLIVPVQVKQEPIDPNDPTLPEVPVTFQLKQEPLDTPEPPTETAAMEPDPIQVPIVNSSSYAPVAAVPSIVATAPKVSPAQKARQRRQIKPNVSALTPRPLAARTANNPPPAPPQQPQQTVRFTLPTPSTVPTFQVTLQPPPPPLLYVTRPELNTVGFISQPTLGPAQPQFIIMQPPMDQFTTQAQLSGPTLSLSGQPSSSPVVQYLGAVPSHLLSSLGILGVTNYVSSMPTLLQTQPMQIPWESSVSSQIVVLNPQQPLLSFNPPTIPAAEPAKPPLKLIKPAEPPAPPTEPARAAEPAAPEPQPAAVAVEPLPAKEPEAVPAAVEEIQSAKLPESDAAAAFAALVESCCETDKGADAEMTEEPSSVRSDSSMSDHQKPPKPTYSYRSAMSGSGKSCKKGGPRHVEEAACESPVVQHLKVVAHPSCPDQATRTFHLKAVATDQDERILSPTEEASGTTSPSSPLDVTVDISSPKVDADVCDVFATPPASSEPPVLPSDMDGDAPSWTTIINPTPTSLPPLPALPATAISAEELKKKEAHILYELVSDDGFYAKSESLSTVWQKLLDAVQDARLAFKMEPLYNGSRQNVEERSLHLTGLHHHALINLLEQLPNADLCPNYTFRYRTHRDRESDEKVTGSAYGCVRAAPYLGRAPYDMFGWLASQYRPRPQLRVRPSSGDQQVAATAGVDAQAGGRRAANFDLLPMTVRFKHLRQSAKNSVGVFRSPIHGRGLFCKRDIESGEMVCEYAGQVIRSVLCDKREKEYEAKGMGCYMFRVDEHTVVDATVHGNAARFINHSCEPNCYSRIVDIQGKKHIIIFASRRILRGEELTYDYKFPLEGPERKIRCNCGSSRKCRKYMN